MPPPGDHQLRRCIKSSQITIQVDHFQQAAVLSFTKFPESNYFVPVMLVAVPSTWDGKRGKWHSGMTGIPLGQQAVSARQELNVGQRKWKQK
jgi:hypothetical protein